MTMLLDDAKYAFTIENINNAPKQNGVYLLYVGEALIYVGRASGFGVTINTRLYNHLMGEEGPRTQKATHYQRQVSTDPVKLEAEILMKYKMAQSRTARRNSA